VAKIPKTKDEQWTPEMVVEFRASQCLFKPHAFALVTHCLLYIGDGTQKTIDMDQKWSSTIYEELMELGGGPAWTRWKDERKAEGLPAVEIPVPVAKPRTQQSLPFQINPLKTGAAAVLP
jgi:small subunit ribosomal protein S25